MFGRTLLSNNSVLPTRVSSDNAPNYKTGGVTIDWNTVVAVNADTTLADGSVVKNGQKFLRYGQVLTKITSGDQQTLTISGSPTGGTFTVTVNGQTTTGVAYNATAATLQAALVALTTVGAGNAVVSGSAGGPYTITFAGSLGALTLATSGASLTGGSSPATAFTTTTATGGNFGWYGPYDPSAVDGRQNQNRGDAWILDETIVQFDTGFGAISPENTQTGRVIDGGNIWIDRVLQSGVGSHTLAAGPTLAEFTTLFPRTSFVKN